MKKSKKEIIIKSIISLLVVCIFFGIIFAIYYFSVGKELRSKEDFIEWIQAAGIYGRLVLLAVMILQVTFIPIPNAIVVAAGAFVYSPLETFFWCFLGTVIGSLLAFLIGRVLGKRAVYWICGKEETEKYLELMNGRENVLVFIMFLLPWFPDDLICLVAGISKMSWKMFMLLLLIGRPWTILISCFFLGGHIIPFKGWGLYVWGGILLIIIGIIIYVIKHRKQFWNLMDRINQKLFVRNKDNNSKSE